jgi:hypothetical protein
MEVSEAEEVKHLRDENSRLKKLTMAANLIISEGSPATLLQKGYKSLFIRMMPETRIQILTHCDPRRSIRACLLALSVPRQMEVLCALNGTLDEVAARLGSIGIPNNLRFLAQPPKSPYPANALRNLALAEATAEWVFYIDCDFVFCDGFWEVILSRYAGFMENLQMACFCPIALWDPLGDASLASPASPDILETETLTSHAPPMKWKDTHAVQLFKYHDMCFTGKFGEGAPVYEITAEMRRLRYSRPAEPWGLLRRKDAAWADEEFGAGPRDKQQFVSTLLDRGMRFFAIADLFIFHLWHPDRCDHWPDRVRNQCLWLKRYDTLPHHYLLTGRPDLFPPYLVGQLESWIRGFAARTPVLAKTYCDANSSSGPPLSPMGHISKIEVILEHVVEALKEQKRVVIGTSYLSRELLGYGYRACVFVHSPAYFRGIMQSNDSLTVIDSEIDRDGYYLKIFAQTADLAEALALADNASAVLDVNNPKQCMKTFRHLTGVHDLEPWFECWTAAQFTIDASAEATDRARHPKDYFLYDCLRSLAGSF